VRSRVLLLRRYLRLSLATLLLACVVAGELALAHRTTQASVATDTAVESDQAIINLATEAESATVDMQTGYRGFLLTGEDTFLEPYTRARGIYSPDHAQLEQLTVEIRGRYRAGRRSTS
jgi:methyl-accepting chemotaxis protein